MQVKSVSVFCKTTATKVVVQKWLRMPGQTLADFHAGKFHHQSAKDVIVALRQSLHEPEA